MNRLEVKNKICSVVKPESEINKDTNAGNGQIRSCNRQRRNQRRLKAISLSEIYSFICSHFHPIMVMSRDLICVCGWIRSTTTLSKHKGGI